MPVVRIVKEEKTGKLRVKAHGKKGWVRFPRHLRVEGAVYEVDEIRPCKGNQDGAFWIACGEIYKRTVRKCKRRKK